MVERRSGRIINIAPAMPSLSVPTARHNSISKAAVIKLTENLAVELRQHNVRQSFAFHPGLVDGGLTHAAIRHERAD
jgi:short-subunit dehydrogenase